MQENTAPARDVTWFREEQRAAVSDFWQAYEAHLSRSHSSTLEWLRGHLELRLAEPVTDLQIIEENQRNLAILARAMHGDAGLYRAQLSGAGRRYAELGVSIAAACDLASGFRRRLLPRLIELHGEEPARLIAAIQAMNDFADYGTAIVTNAFIGHKEAQSKNREQDLATTLDSIGDAVIVTDNKGAVVRMNPVAERLLGFVFADCRGRRLEDVFRIEDEDTGRGIESPVHRVLREGVVVGLTARTVLISRDGTRHPIADSGAPVRNEAGDVRGVVLVFRDVSEERRAEEGLKHWERIFQHATWGVAVASAEDLRFQAVNPMYASMHGYSVEELVGAPVSTVWTPETAAEMEAHAKGAEGSGRLVLETSHRRKDGSHLPVEIVATAIKDETGKARWLVANVNDITERRRHQQSQLRAVRLEAENRRIEEANRLKSEFLASMSHELRTPLNSIIGFAELIFDEHVGSLTPKQREFLGDILAGGHHLLRLINEVLDLAKVEAGKMEFCPEPSDLRQLAGTVVQSLRGAAREKDLVVELSVDPTLDEIVLDPGRFKQILYNYLSNALKFTPDGGRVSVRVSAEGDAYFRVEVEDTGPGISNDDLPRLFTAFQQLDTGAAKRHAGTGLGLALTKQLAAAQGGTVGVRPSAPSGSSFFAVLPRRPAPPSPPEYSRDQGAAAWRDQPVFVIDDDTSSLKLMEATLAKLGYEAQCFSSARDALRAMTARRPMAVILDLVMPAMDGPAFLREFRAAPENSDVPVMIWTVKDLSVEEQRRLLESAGAVVQKGVEDSARLAATLQRFFETRAAIR